MNRSTLVDPDIIMFAPFFGIPLHSSIEQHISTTLQKAGARVALVACDGILKSRCVVMESKAIAPSAAKEEREAVCIKCRAIRRSSLAQASLGDGIIALEDFADQSVRDAASDILGAFLKNPTPAFEWEGVSLGAFWSYETTLRFKSAELTESSLQHLSEIAESGAVAHAVAHHLVTQARPGAVLVHSMEYGVNRSFIAPFVRAGVPCYTFFNAGQYSQWDQGFTILPLEQNVIVRSDRARNRTAEACRSPLGQAEFAPLSTWSDDKLLQRSALVYSNSRSERDSSHVRDLLSLPDRPTVLVPSSSPDERHAATLAQLLPPDIAPYDPEEHYRFAKLVVLLSQSNPDLNFVYRLHPRLAPNRRDAEESPHLKRLVDLLASRPANLYLNTPDQGLGLYDLAMVTDVVLHWSSTAGLELLLLGIPLVGVTDSPVRILPDDMHTRMCPGDVDLLSESIRSCIQEGWSEQAMRSAARWIVASTSRTVVPVPRNRSSQPSLPRWVRALGRLAPRATRPAITSIVHRALQVFQVSRNLLIPKQTPVLDTKSEPPADWQELLSRWVDWRELPDRSSPETEAEVLARFSSHVVKRLAPWDGSEGAVASLKRFAENHETLKSRNAI